MEKLKCLLVLVCLLFGPLFESELKAVFLNADGYYALRGEFAKNRALNDEIFSRYDVIRHRLWLTLDFKLTDKLSVLSSVGAFYTDGEDYLGDHYANKELIGQYDEYKNSSAFSHQLDPVNWGVYRLWANYLSDYGNFIFGRAPKHFGLGLYYNEGRGLFDSQNDTVDQVAYYNSLGALNYRVGYDKFQETSSCVTPCTDVFGAINGSDDMYGFYISLNYKLEKRVFDFYWEQIRRGLDDTKINLYLLAANLDFFPFFLRAEMDVMDGRTQDQWVKKKLGGLDLDAETSNKVKGVSFLMQTGYQFLAKHQAQVDFGYSSGDPDLFEQSDSRDNSAKSLGFHPNHRPALLMFNYPVEIMELSDSTTYSNTPLYSDGVLNAFYIKPSYQYKGSSFGSITVQGIYGWLNKTNPTEGQMGYDKELGFELDVLYHKLLTPQIGLNLDAGLMLAGDAWKSDDVSAKHSYLFQATMQFLF